MLVTEGFSTETDAGQAAHRGVSLRLPDGKLVPIAAGKHSIGSGPRCSVRLQDPGVQPIHCLIVHDGHAVRVRRWATDTLLNGEAFDESPLVCGDLLTIGSAELEVVESTATTPAPVESDPQPDSLPESPQEPSDEFEPASEWGSASEWEPATQQDPASEWEPPGESESPELAAVEAAPADLPEPPPTADECPRLREATAAARRRSRKLLASLRSNRHEFAELMERMDALERKVETAIGQQASQADDLWEAEPTDVDVEESASWADQWPESTGDSVEPPTDPAVVAELATTRQQLADAQRQLADALATIETLEQQLAEQHEERRQLADERADWLGQMTELEERLSEYAERVPELEAQLEQLCEATEAAGRVRRSSSQETPAVPTDAVPEEPPAAPDDQYNWGANAAGDQRHETDDESAVDQPGWSPPGAAAEPTEPGAAAPATEGEPAGDFDWAGLGGATWPARTDVDRQEEDQTGAADDEADAEAGDDSAPPAEPGMPGRKSDDLEGVAERLRRLSLWRDEAADAGDSVADPAIGGETVEQVEPSSAEERATDEAAVAAEAIEPAGTVDSRTASFIERYAHLLEDDEAGPTPPPLEPEPEPMPTADQGSPAESIDLLAAGPSVTEAAVAGDDNEESIEQYMAKMMTRLRGDSPPAPASQAPPQAAKPAVVQQSTSAASASGSAPISEPATAEVDRPQRKRGPAPEQNTDMAALRALANQTARHAIGVHAAGKLRRHAVTRFIIALLAGTASLYFFLAAPGWESLQFATASVALAASIWWGLLTFGSLIQAVREGAFEDHEPEFAAVDSLSDPLPIDVEH